MNPDGVINLKDRSKSTTLLAVQGSIWRQTWGSKSPGRKLRDGGWTGTDFHKPGFSEGMECPALRAGVTCFS
ncbi:hypothetical protein VTO42DRAFT_8330 [Malbranchea cinnamomea]